MHERIGMNSGGTMVYEPLDDEFTMILEVDQVACLVDGGLSGKESWDRWRVEETEEYMYYEVDRR